MPDASGTTPRMSETPPGLQPFGDAPATLELRKESWKRKTLDIVGDGKAFGRLDYGRWSRQGRAQAHGANWIFSRDKGVLNRRIEITRENRAEVSALGLRTFKRGGELELGGATYAISASGILKERWACERDGTELFALRERGSFGKRKCDIELSDAGRRDPNVALLVLLAVHVNRTSDSAGGSGAAGASG